MMRLACALLLASALLQEDAARELVKKLKSVEERESAAARLLELGEKARPALEEAAEGPDPDLRARAKEVLAGIKVRAHSGRVAGSSLWWIRREALELLAEPARAPDAMKRDLFDAHELRLVLVAPGKGAFPRSAIDEFVFTERGGSLRHGARSGPDGDSFCQVEESVSSPDPVDLSGSAVFRKWPRLRTAAFVFAMPGPITRETVAEVMKDKAADVRAAGVWTLQNFFEPESVEAAAAALRDGDASVAQAARETLQVLSGKDAGDAEEFAKWWGELTGHRRTDLLRDQWVKFRVALNKDTTRDYFKGIVGD